MTILMQVLHTEKYKINYSENRGQKVVVDSAKVGTAIPVKDMVMAMAE